MINYYNNITHNFGVLKSEKIVFSQYIPENAMILDVGCGVGRITNFLFNEGKNIIGIDISVGMIKQAKKNFPSIKFKECDITNLMFSDNIFNVIIFSFNGLMTIPGNSNRNDAVKEVYRTLSKDGLFIFSTPFLDNKINTTFWEDRLKNISKNNVHDLFLEDEGVDDIYIHVPFLSSVRKMLIDNNFSIVFEKPRMDICIEDDQYEELLDDNYYFVAKK